jgi:hypothetical protein
VKAKHQIPSAKLQRSIKFQASESPLWSAVQFLAAPTGRDNKAQGRAERRPGSNRPKTQALKGRHNRRRDIPGIIYVALSGLWIYLLRYPEATLCSAPGFNITAFQACRIAKSKLQKTESLPALWRTLRCNFLDVGIWNFSGAWLLVLGCFCPLAVFASDEKIPPLLPLHGELEPTFWEQNGWLFIVGGAVVLVLLSLGIWLFTRPKPVVIEPPAVLARRALEPLRARAEDGALVSEVSRIVRRYVLSALNFPPEELTTTEFRAVLSSRPSINPEVSGAVGDFLRRCDQWKFAPEPPAPQLGAVTGALELVEKVEQSKWQISNQELAEPKQSI